MGNPRIGEQMNGSWSVPTSQGDLGEDRELV